MTTNISHDCPVVIRRKLDILDCTMEIQTSAPIVNVLISIIISKLTQQTAPGIPRRVKEGNTIKYIKRFKTFDCEIRTLPEVEEVAADNSQICHVC